MKKTGEVIELHCSYDPETKSGTGFEGRKVKGTLHWVAEDHGIKAEVRLYDYLFIEDEEEGDLKLNPDSLKILKDCIIEPSITEAKPGDKFQFLRHGYFCIDTKESTEDNIIFNRIVSLRSSWKK